MLTETAKPEEVRAELIRRRTKLAARYPGRDVKVVSYVKSGRWCFSSWVRVKLPAEGAEPIPSVDNLLSDALTELRRVASSVGPLHSSWDVISNIEAGWERARKGGAL